MRGERGGYRCCVIKCQSTSNEKQGIKKTFDFPRTQKGNFYQLFQRPIVFSIVGNVCV